jgi:hypothetical protein
LTRDKTSLQVKFLSSLLRFLTVWMTRKKRRSPLRQDRPHQLVILLREGGERFRRRPTKNLKTRKKETSIKLCSRKRSCKNFKKEAMKTLAETSKSRRLSNAIR